MGFFSRWWRKPAGQDASHARVGRDLYQFSDIGTVVLPEQRPPDPTDDEYQAAYTAYAKRLRERYGRLDLEVLTPLNEQGEHPVVELREVFVPQSVRADPPPVELPRELLQRLADAGAAADALALPPGIDREAVDRVRQAYEQRPARPVLEVVADPEHDRIVVLGDPGAGKSTLARYLALALTAEGGPVAGLEALHGRLPLVVELRIYAEAAWRDRSFEDFLGHLHEDEGLGLPPRMLADCLAGTGPRQVLVVFDGLDELFEKGIRDAVARRIAGFAAKYPATRIVVTSRRVGYQRAVLDGAGFADFLLQDLDREQIGAFTRRWFTLACPDDHANARKLEQRVLTAVDGSASVRSLAGNPLILTILAIIGRRRELPRDRKTVYEHAVAVLVEHWDLDKFLKDSRVEEHLPYLGTEDKLELLRLVARRMQEGEAGIAGNHIAGLDLIAAFEGYLSDRYALPPDRAATAARIMVDQFRYRNFILSRFGGEVYGFVHRTFLEYLTATDLAHRFQSERSLSEEELYEAYEAHWQDPAWHEILLLLTGLLDERFAGRAIDRVLTARPFGARAVAGNDSSFAETLFAAECLAEVRKPGLVQQQAIRLVTLLIKTMEVHRSCGAHWYAANGLLVRTGPALRSLGPHWAGRRLFLDWHQEAQHRFDEKYGLGAMAASVAVALCNDDEGHAEASLIDLAGNANSLDTRRRAMTSLLARAGSQSRDRFQALALRLAQDDPVPEMRSFVLELLAVRLPAVPLPPETLPLLRGRAEDDESAAVRQAALHVLVSTSVTGPDQTAALTFLRSRTQEGSDETRLAALALLKDHDVEAVDQIAIFARHSESVEVRRAALHDLARCAIALWDEPNSRWTNARIAEFVRERAVADQEPEVRVAALEALSGPYLLMDRPAAVEFFRNRAVHDPAAEVRSSALGDLYFASGGDFDQCPFVIERIRQESEPGALARAIHMLSMWMADPGWDTYADGGRALLIDHAARHTAPEVRAAAVAALDVIDAPTARLLVRLAREDASEAVRTAAVEALIGYPDCDTLLTDRAAHDPHPTVRRTALLAAVRHAPDDSATLALLADRAAHDGDDDLREWARGLHDALKPE
ncbi:signal transduction protein with Nacht domain protein [Streptomyces solincola]|uniref:Signal transduction protein with Nacht domain protein n=1 Tax=Streptomyces solincola TaxID=2100817 RepID=A0A2S9Q1G3_9ACTN|nr:NACHT domain-containing protein [Streptomyces solincola]PRH80453.1 signal transduction protein with Nacht domain protein [Streptomyces solincola]